MMHSFSFKLRIVVFGYVLVSLVGLVDKNNALHVKYSINVCLLKNKK